MKKIKYKLFFIILFSIYKKRQPNIIKNTKKDSEKKHVKHIKIFVKKKRPKTKKSPREIPKCY